MHDILMSYGKELTKDVIMGFVRYLKLDEARFEKDVESKEVAQMLVKNMGLARHLGIDGTPMFVLGDSMTMPGAVSLDEFNKWYNNK